MGGSSAVAAAPTPKKKSLERTKTTSKKGHAFSSLYSLASFMSAMIEKQAERHLKIPTAETARARQDLESRVPSREIEKAAGRFTLARTRSFGDRYISAYAAAEAMRRFCG